MPISSVIILKKAVKERYSSSRLVNQAVSSMIKNRTRASGNEEWDFVVLSTCIVSVQLFRF